MSKRQVKGKGRRAFLKSAGVFAVSTRVLVEPGTGLAAAESSSLPADSPSGPSLLVAEEPGYQFFGPREADFAEALVDHMWPKDELTASGAEIGIAVFIDRQLAGAFGQGDRLYLQGPFRKGKPQHGYQSPMTPAAYFRSGVENAEAVCRRLYQRTFDRLTAEDREQFLQDVAAGRLTEGDFDLGAWFNALVYPLFVRGAFADPLYGGNRGKVAWRMIGYPGLPAVYGQDVVRYRGKRHPRSQDPKSIEDFG